MKNCKQTAKNCKQIVKHEKINRISNTFWLYQHRNYVLVLQPFTYDIIHEVHFRFHLLSQKILAIKWPKGQIWKGLKKCVFVHKVIDGILAAFHYRGGHTNVQV